MNRKTGLVLSLLALFFVFSSRFAAAADFDGSAAYGFAEQQMSLGSRTPGSTAHAEFITLAVEAFSKAGWTVQTLKGKANGQTATNLLIERPQPADRNGKNQPWVVIGAHFDSRLHANEDPDEENRTSPVPGGNDGASGVAVLYGLAVSLEKDLPVRVTLALFDLEDQGSIEPYHDWCLGSKMVAKYYASLPTQPDAVVLLDMIGDPDLNVYRERNSDPALGDEIWGVAADLGYGDKLVNLEKFTIYDDHIPFIQNGMRAVDLIDFDDPEWHTLKDDIGNVSQESLQVIGEVMMAWLDRVVEKGIR